MRTGPLVAALCFQILLAISSSQVSATCLNSPVSAPDSDSRAIEATTRDLAGTDASLTADLVRLAEGTTPRFQTAISAGFAQAAIAYGSVDQQASLLIRQTVGSLEDRQFQASFAAVAGDLSTAATTAAAADASSSAGSVVATNPNSSSKSAPASGGGTASMPALTSAALSINTTNIAPARTSTTATEPVSPTR
jgi:hypothetical protein